MKLTVVGHWGAYPGPGGASSGYLLEENNESLLLDCGSGVLAKLYEYTDISQLNNVVLSHYHSDHIASIGPITLHFKHTTHPAPALAMRIESENGSRYRVE